MRNPTMNPNAVFLFSLLAFSIAPLIAKPPPSPVAGQHVVDVIYGRKFGVALTLDVFQPAQKANGAAVIWVVSGGWVSAHAFVDTKAAFSPVQPLLDRGYTVFAVVHGCQPKFTIPEIVEDMNRAA